MKENRAAVRAELIAGAMVSLSMAYILAVNPAMLADSGMDRGAAFTAAAISAAASTLVMAFLANYPVALALGIGLNAYFTYSVCIPLAGQGIYGPWRIALAAVFREGTIFILLSICKFRETLINDVPRNLKFGITAGIGLFITLIGLSNGGIVAASSSALVDLGKVPSAPLPWHSLASLLYAFCTIIM